MASRTRLERPHRRLDVPQSSTLPLRGNGHGVRVDFDALQKTFEVLLQRDWEETSERCLRNALKAGAPVGHTSARAEVTALDDCAANEVLAIGGDQV